MSESPQLRPRFDDVPQARRRNLAAVRARDTVPELRVRRILHAMGVRFRLHRRDLPGTPDIAMAGRRKIVEVRGCFWHCHGGCRNSVLPRTRAEWWAGKLARTVARDAANLVALQSSGWSVLVVWECETKDALLLHETLRSFVA